MDKNREFEQIYHQYYKPLYIYALKFVAEQIAQDIVQDIFVTIWNTPPVLRTSLKSYLFTAVRNACLDYIKGMKVKENYINQRLLQLQLDEIAYYQTEETSILEEEQLNLIYTTIEELPEKCKEIFKLSYFNNMKSNEIAQKLDLSVRTVQNQLYKGLIKIREIIMQKLNT